MAKQFILSIGLSTALFASAAFAQNNEPQSEPSSPWSFSGTYVGDFLTNVEGGISQAGGYIDNTTIQVDFDGSGTRLNGLRGTIGVIYNNGGNFSGRRVGDLQGISNIEAGEPGFYMSEAWLSYNFGRQIDGEGAAMLKAGIIDLNTMLDAPGVSGIFLNPSHGIVPNFAQTGNNGPSIFPQLGLGAVAQYRFNRGFALRGGAFDANPGNANDPTKIDLAWRKKDGTLWVGEGEITSEAGRIVLGGFKYSNATATLLGAPDKKNSGMYAQAEVNASERLAFFARGGVSDKSINIIDKYWGAGLTYTGLFNSRSEDVLGFAIADGRISNDGRAFLGGSKGNETNYELTYATHLTKNLAIQGDIQYIVNPGADSNIPNATVVGMRIKYAFGTN